MRDNANTDTLIRLGDTDLQIADPNEDVRGRKVVDRNGDDIGHVDALMVDQRERRIRFLRVASGGFLGIGERTFLIPIDAVVRVTPDEVRIDQTRQHLIGAPVYDPNLTYRRDYYNDIYNFYGYAPYWAPGYVYPPYPYARAQRTTPTSAATTTGPRAARPVGDMSNDNTRTMPQTGGPLMAEPAVDLVLDQIHHGMRVVDASGETIGHVDYIKMGDPGAATVDSGPPPENGLLDAMLGDGEPDVPEPLHSRLLREGYMKVDGTGWLGRDRYAPGDEIARIAGDTVTLTVDKDHLIDET
jgi:sporulation protein YlmC with PRC-barrel domain